LPHARCALAEENLAGEQIFASKCVRCHGSEGAGTEEHSTPLEGDYSPAQLAEIIGETMPEDDPGSLTAAEARSVAEYIHTSFYSAVARERHRPARIALARLTVAQYRHAVADLFAGFSPPAKASNERGLTGEYFNSRQPAGEKNRAATRLDPQVDFDFGSEAPLPGITDPDSYSIRWSGSVIAPETGEYEFVVRTRHAARLWINDPQQALIDAWVKSGDEAEYKAGKFLVGGRCYALRLEFTKAKQGVSDRKKSKKRRPAVPASLTLLWQRPGGAPEPIPTWYLSPTAGGETFVCDTPFPPDDRSYGWERGTAISPEWDEATTVAAIAAAGYVADRLDMLAGSSDDAVDRQRKLRTFCKSLAERAFRQPLEGDLMGPYIDRQFQEAGDPETAVLRIVLLVLKSPRFLFREVGGPEAFQVASRLSFGLWDSIPDDALLNAARSGELSDADAVRRQAERMLSDPRAKAKLREFLWAWLRLDGDADLSKDAHEFPGFDTAMIADLRTSLELFLDDVVWSERSDYRRLLLDDEVFVNDRIAPFYGADFKPGDGFAKIRLDGGKRAGVLTHPFVMARYAYRRESSPIHRGVFLTRGILGQSLRPPPAAFAPLAAELHPDLTTRERVALQTKDAACMMCHAIINPLGFALEKFDAAGRYREFDRGKPIDDTAKYGAPEGEAVRLRGARELAAYLAEREECHTAFVEQLFHYLVQQPVQAYGPMMLEQLRQSFAAAEFNIRRLAVEIMVATSLVGRDTME
jgi:hypothetical protein